MHVLLVVYTNILSSLNLYTVSIATSYPSFNYSIIYSNIFAVWTMLYMLVLSVKKAKKNMQPNSLYLCTFLANKADSDCKEVFFFSHDTSRLKFNSCLYLTLKKKINVFQRTLSKIKEEGLLTTLPQCLKNPTAKKSIKEDKILFHLLPQSGLIENAITLQLLICPAVMATTF